MGVIQCEECTYVFSDKRNSCPKCGCPKQLEVHKENTIPLHNTVENKKGDDKILLKAIFCVITTIIVVCVLNSLPNGSWENTSKNKVATQPPQQNTQQSNTLNNNSNNSLNNYTYNSSYDTTNTLSLSKYEKIREGMTYNQVVSILGSKGNLVSSTNVAGESIRGYGWYSEYGIPMICVVFQNGKVNYMYQVGLQ